MPGVFGKKPLAILARNIASPDFELVRFIKLSKKIKLEPVCLEFLDDKFCSQNPDKLSYVKMYFYGGKGENGGPNLICKKLANFNAIENIPFKKIKTNTGKSLVKLHHQITHKYHP